MRLESVRRATGEVEIRQTKRAIRLICAFQDDAGLLRAARRRREEKGRPSCGARPAAGRDLPDFRFPSAPPPSENDLLQKTTSGLIAFNPLDLRLEIAVACDAKLDFLSFDQRLGCAQAKASARQIDDFNRKLASI